jgi:hypothetical protein
VANEDLGDAQLVYANWIRLDVTPYDCGMDFGYREDEAPPERFPVRVVMSWEHLKQTAKLLTDTVEMYERGMGAVREFGVEPIISTKSNDDPDPADAPKE